MNYKIITSKVREHLSEENKSISGIEKHLIQEGLKQILLGTGPIDFSTPGISYRTITPSLEGFMLDLGVITKDNHIENELETKQEFLTWNYKGLTNNANFFGTQRDWNQTLVTRINELYSKSIREEDGPFNCIITSPEVASIIEDLEYFHPISMQMKNIDIKNSLNLIGILSGKYQVFIDYYIPINLVHCKKIEISKEQELTGVINKSTLPKFTPEDFKINNTIKVLNL